MFDDFKTLFVGIVDDIRNMRFGDALRKNSELSDKLAEFYDLLTGNTPPAFGAAGGDDDAAAKAADECIAECSAARGPRAVGALDPATILLIIKASAEAFKLLRDWWTNRNP